MSSDEDFKSGDLESAFVTGTSLRRKAVAERLIKPEYELSITQDEKGWDLESTYADEEFSATLLPVVPRYLVFVTVFYDHQVLRHEFHTADGLPDEDVPSASLHELIKFFYGEYRGDYDWNATIFDLDQECEIDFERQLVFKKVMLAPFVQRTSKEEGA